MPSRRHLAIVLLLAAMTLSQPAAAAAGDWLGWRKKATEPQSNSQPAHSRRPAVPYTPRPIVVASPPGPYRSPAYAGKYPWYGYGFGVPTYQWGYCGSTFRPVEICHFGYYDDYSQFGYRRGY